jgi:hypothetical protein
MNLQKPLITVFSKLKNEWMKRPLFYSVFIFSVIFLFSRLIILFIPYVEITYDSITYVNYIDKYIANGVLPPVDYLPIGFPIIIKLLSFLSSSIYSIVIIQNLFTYFGCVLIVYAVEKRFPFKSLFIVFAVSIFVLSPKNLYYDIMLSTESLYVSSLMILSALLILSIGSFKKRHWIALSIALFIPILFRPNGVFTLVLFLILLLYCILKIKERMVLVSFVLPYVFCLILFAGYSFLASDTVTISSPSRMKEELNMRSGMSEGAQIEFGKECLCIEKPSFRKMVKQYYFFNGFHSFNPKLQNIYEKYHDFHWPKDLNYIALDHSTLENLNGIASEKEKQKTFKEFYYISFIESIELRAKKYRQSILFKTYDWYQIHIHKYIFASLLWPILFFLSFFIGLFQYFKGKLSNQNYLILILIGLINIGTNMIHIITTHRTLARYEYPGEFLYYLVPFFLLICLTNAKQ